MFETRHRLKRVPTTSGHLYRTMALVLVVSVFGLAAPSPAAVPTKRLAPSQVRVRAVVVPVPRKVPRPRVIPISTDLLAFTNAPTPTQSYVVSLIHSDFPPAAWHDAAKAGFSTRSSGG